MPTVRAQTSLSIAALLLVAPAFAGVCPPLDLTGWTLVDPDDDWTAQNPTPTSVKLVEQKSSSSVHPGWVVSDFTLAATSVIEFDLGVDAGTGDDDLIGFGFSWLNSSHSYLLDWKKAGQSFNWGDDGVIVNDDFAETGMKIKRIDGGYTWDGLWGGSDGAGVTTVAGPVGGGWNAGTIYHFRLELSPGHMLVERDGVPIFDVKDPSYPGAAGSICVYGFSQNFVTASDICITPEPTVCPADLDHDGQVNGSDYGLLLAAWGSDDEDADLDGNGIVDGADLGQVLAA